MRGDEKKSRVLIFIAAVALTLVIATLFFLTRSRQHISSAETSKLVGEQPAPAPTPRELIAPTKATTGVPPKLADFCGRLRRGEADGTVLAAFRRELLNGEPQATIAAIRDFLATGEDSATGQRFTIAPGGGELEGAPTFRVWLLDVLGVLDRTAGTGESAATSRLILTAKTSADEWALALRNVAWSDPQSAPFLAAKFRELVTHEAWLAAPSAGFLETFDAAVFVHDATLVLLLGDLVQRENREVQHAAAMALDRMAEADPLAVMNYLNEHPDAFAQRPLLRADYFAKANLGEPSQREALERYLGRSDVLLPEKTKLIKALAAPASFVSDTLFTASPPPADDTGRFAALERAVSQWTAARRFPELAPTLAELQQRLRDR